MIVRGQGHGQGRGHEAWAGRSCSFGEVNDSLDQTLIAPPPFVEVELVYEAGRAGLTGRGWCALQVWTQKSVYDVDWGMRCFRVTDRATDEAIPGHRLLNAKLTGGQKRDGRNLELVYPVPSPGVAAVFEVGEGKDAEYVTTSEVSRVVLRLRVISVTEEEKEPSWKGLSGSFEVPEALRGTRVGHDDP